MIGVSRTTLWRMVQAGTFPRPVCITHRNRGYLRTSVEAWMKARTTELPFDIGTANSVAVPNSSTAGVVTNVRRVQR
jgi:hypothetical protein